MINEYEDKYIDLILKRCLNLKISNSLFINYPKILKEFIKKVANRAKQMGIEDIYLKEEDIFEKKKLLEEMTIEEINNSEKFQDNIWDEYAKKNAAFLIFSSIIPHVLDDTNRDKLDAVARIKMKSKPVYRSKQASNEISWCIAVMPNKLWAKEIYPNILEEEAYLKLFKLIMHITKVDLDDSIKEWDKEIEKERKITKRLNELKITKMHYKNKLGTDLIIELNKDSYWKSAGSDFTDRIVNMPTYEVFTSPDYRKTRGIVYSTKPLTYNGVIVDNFWIKFKDGKVIDYGAKTGEEVLRSIIESDEQSSYLGEVALVSKNSEIAKSKVVFAETCLDENASCHIALGNGFIECIKDGDKKSKEELLENGINQSKNHVDFMIGSEDLNIEATTIDGKKYIFKDGDFYI